jgi:RNA polymerase sigma factor (sigma-70 family)
MAPHATREELDADLAAAWPVVFNRLAARFRDPQLADEVSSDALARAWEKWAESPDYFTAHDLTTWSTRRGTWKALDQLRQRLRQRPLPDEQGESETGRTAGRPRWESASHERERTVELVWACLQRLPEPERSALVAHHYDGLTDQEVGSVLFGEQGTPQARGLRVWRLRQRGYALLRDELVRAGAGEETAALSG